MRTVKIIGIAFLIFTAGICGLRIYTDQNAPSGLQVQVLETPTPAAPAVTGEFITDMMTRCGAGLSAAKTAILRDQILRVLHARVEGLEAQQAFVYILCIESKYQQKAKSSVGAVGIAQIMPKFANDFAKMCALGDIQPDDIQDTEVNLILGACLFNKLVKDTGNIMLAAASYNAGQASATVKNLKVLQAGAAETMAYVSKVAYLAEETKRKEEKQP
jgi:hypothetical protein